MVKFIKNQIIKHGKISEEKGIEKYREYFINTSLYEQYRSEVDALLEEEGYGFCIVKFSAKN